MKKWKNKKNRYNGKIRGKKRLFYVILFHVWKRSLKIENDYNFPLFFPQFFFSFIWLIGEIEGKKNCYLVKFLFDMINKSSSSIMRILFGKSVK